ncbi:MAG: hypothetical protein GY828_01515 [Candidatus Gracilibacteria bacterium]|nr:hypothetical protein [Candidatus Gracilibacteria bacterium]
MDNITIGYFVVLGILLAIIPLFIMYRNGKGKIIYHGVESEYKVGSDVKGQIELIAKRDLHIGYVEVIILGEFFREVVVEKYNSETGGVDEIYETKSEEVFQIIHKINRKGKIQSGDNRLLPFNFSGTDIEKQINDFCEKNTSKIYDIPEMTIKRLLTEGPFQTSIYTYVDCKGVDLEKYTYYKMYS